MNSIAYVVVTIINDKYEGVDVCSTPSLACAKISEITKQVIKVVDISEIGKILAGTPYSGTNIEFKDVDK